MRHWEKQCCSNVSVSPKRAAVWMEKMTDCMQKDGVFLINAHPSLPAASGQFVHCCTPPLFGSFAHPAHRCYYFSEKVDSGFATQLHALSGCLLLCMVLIKDCVMISA